MADSEPAVYSAPGSPGLVVSTAQGVRAHTKLIALLSIGHFIVDLNALTPLLAVAVTRFPPAPRAQEVR